MTTLIETTDAAACTALSSVYGIGRLIVPGDRPTSASIRKS